MVLLWRYYVHAWSASRGPARPSFTQLSSPFAGGIGVLAGFAAAIVYKTHNGGNCEDASHIYLRLYSSPILMFLPHHPHNLRREN